VTLVRYQHDGRPGWGRLDGDRIAPLETGLAGLLRQPLAAARRVVEGAGEATLARSAVRLLAPVDRQEVWAAGVTYQRSLEGRIEESGAEDLYDRAYLGERPEIFFKSTPERVVGDGEPVGIRRDSPWNVPEPEVGIVLTSELEVFGFTVGDDVSSRSIEGENALYLPQAKVYDRACSLGPGIVPCWVAGDGPFAISMRVLRDGREVFSDETSTARLRRSWTELAGWLGRALTFDAGAVLLTGTGIVPDRSFTLRDGDLVAIDVDRVGTLRNPVITVGR
jgi:2-dehydro-3-deoxy-D-arabinonate dehydratase